MEIIVQGILKFICNNMKIDDEDMIDVYKYGIEILLSSFLNFLMIIVSSIVYGDLTAGLVFMVIFILLRSYCGGYHAEKYWRCNLVFIFTYTVIFFIAKVLSAVELKQTYIILIFILDFIPIIRYAPVKNIHKELTQSEQKKSRLLSIVIFWIGAAVAVICQMLYIWYGYVILMTVTAVSVMILIEVYMQKKGIHKSV